MRFLGVSVESWRCFDRLQIDFPPDTPIVCLVGENGSGKSSLLTLLTSSLAWMGIDGASSELGFAEVPATGEEVVSAHIDLALGPEQRAALLAALGEVRSDIDAALVDSARVSAEQWDGTIRIVFSGAVKAPPRFVAGGLVDGSQAETLGDLIVRAFRWVQARSEVPKVGYLYLGPNRWSSLLGEQGYRYPGGPRIPDSVWRPQPPNQVDSVVRHWQQSYAEEHSRAMDEWRRTLEAKAISRELPDPPPVTPVPPIPMLDRVLPYLRPANVDSHSGQGMFEARGRRVPFQDLSSGEKDVVALAIAQDQLKQPQSIILIDEPELHTNPDLVRRRINVLRETATAHQILMTTHSYEVVEAVGAGSVIHLWRTSPEGHVDKADPWAADQAFATLAASMGMPAFSVADKRFVFVEGTIDPDTGHRFELLAGINDSISVLPADGCAVVLARLQHVLQFAVDSEYSSLFRIGAVIDGDFRSQDEVRALEQRYGGAVHVLDCHDEENLFLHPDAIELFWQEHGRSPRATATAHETIRDAADAVAGAWILKRAKHSMGTALAGELNTKGTLAGGREKWTHIEPDQEAWLTATVQLIDPGTEYLESVRSALSTAITAYGQLRLSDDLWQWCFGRRTIGQLVSKVEAKSTDRYIDWTARKWRKGDLGIPGPLASLRVWLSALPRASDIQLQD